MQTPPLIAYAQVGKSFGGRGAERVLAVDEVSLDVAEGEFLAIVGGSGSGKTTLLRLANRLIDADLRSIRVEGEDVRAGEPVSVGRRIGVARALGANPRVVLMVEPFGALDPLTRDALGDDYRALHRQLGLTTVMITHDMTEAILLADRIAVMRAGRLLAQGTPSELSNSGDAYVGELLRTPRRQAERLKVLLPKDGAADGA